MKLPELLAESDASTKWVSMHQDLNKKMRKIWIDTVLKSLRDAGATDVKYEGGYNEENKGMFGDHSFDNCAAIFTVDGKEVRAWFNSTGTRIGEAMSAEKLVYQIRNEEKIQAKKRNDHLLSLIDDPVEKAAARKKISARMKAKEAAKDSK